MNVLENEYDFRGVARPDLDDISSYYQESESNFWLAFLEDKIVGTIGLKNYGNNKGYFKRFYVEQSLRGRGVGKQLFATVMRFAKDNGYKELYLGTTEKMTEAIPFYEHRGFKRIESLPSDIPTLSGDTIFLKLDL